MHLAPMPTQIQRRTAATSRLPQLKARSVATHPPAQAGFLRLWVCIYSFESAVLHRQVQGSHGLSSGQTFFINRGCAAAFG
jgi:hypothetical protein